MSDEKRMLNDDEKKMVKKSINRLEQENRHSDFLYRYNRLMLDEGLYWNYQDKIKQHKRAEKDILGEVNNNKSQIKLLKKQLKEGVEKKTSPTGVE